MPVGGRGVPETVEVGVAVDREDRVYLICRGDHPVIMYDNQGNFKGSWGEGEFSHRTHGIYVAPDGTIYGTQTGDTNPDTWRIYKVTPQGQSSVFYQGAPMNRPNGIAFDPQGNIVVCHIGTNDVHTFSPDGRLLKTEQAVDPGNDGLAITADGTKYVSSVMRGTISRIRPGQPAEIVASGIPSPASMTYDPKRNRLVVPMNDWNAIAFVELGK